MSELERARDLVPRLKREIEQRRVLIMVGAGVSSAASEASVASGVAYWKTA